MQISKGLAMTEGFSCYDRRGRSVHLLYYAIRLIVAVFPPGVLLETGVFGIIFSIFGTIIYKYYYVSMTYGVVSNRVDISMNVFEGISQFRSIESYAWLQG